MPMPTERQVNAATARAFLGEVALGYTNAQVTQSLAKVNQDQLYDTERANYAVEVWDRQSPINGVPAADILARRTDIPPTGDVVLVRGETGDVVLFQPHEPAAEGIVGIPQGQGLARGAEMANNIAASRAQEKVVELVMDDLAASG